MNADLMRMNRSEAVALGQQDDDRPRVPVAVIMPVLQGRTVTPAAGLEPYPVPGIRYVQGGSLYDQAMASVQDQTVLPVQVNMALDGPTINTPQHGAGATRQRALALTTDRVDWVSFLDDDDLWYPHHLETHLRILEQQGGDVAYSWFDGNDPFPMHRGRAFDPEKPHHTTMTITVRRELAMEAGKMFAQPDGPMHQDWSGEDWAFILRLIELGAKFVGTGDVTWHYRVHYGNTSGLTTKGDALIEVPW